MKKTDVIKFRISDKDRLYIEKLRKKEKLTISNLIRLRLGLEINK